MTLAFADGRPEVEGQALIGSDGVHSAVRHGWGGRDIEPSTGQPFECDYGPSL